MLRTIQVVQVIYFCTLSNCTACFTYSYFVDDQFTFLDYKQQVRREDLGRPIMYRTPSMRGWAFKTATCEDLKYGVVQGKGRRV